MDSWIFILYLGYNPMLFNVDIQIFPAVDNVGPLHLAPLSLWHSTLDTRLLKKKKFILLAHQDVSYSSCIFSSPDLEATECSLFSLAIFT